MASEAWLAEVDAVGCSEWTGTLRDARDGENSIALTGIREYLYDIDPGHYYWQVSAPACDWSVDLVPIDLGADPGSTPAPRVPVPQLFGENWSRTYGETNPGFLTATQARQAILDAGLTVGECTQEPQGFVGEGRVWGQDPAPGSLLEMGSPVDVFIVSDCDVVVGDRVIME